MFAIIREPFALQNWFLVWLDFMPRAKPINPFYVLLVLVGIVFTVTASAYGVMTFRASQGGAAVASADLQHPLWHLMDQYGGLLLLGELVLLTLFSFGAMATDSYWTAKDQRAASDDAKSKLHEQGAPQ